MHLSLLLILKNLDYMIVQCMKKVEKIISFKMYVTMHLLKAIWLSTTVTATEIHVTSQQKESNTIQYFILLL